MSTTTSLGDKPVNRIGYGAMQLAGPGVFGPPRDPDAARAVSRESRVRTYERRRLPSPGRGLLQDCMHPAACAHLDAIRPVVPRTPQGCEECLAIGSPWLHLRLCLTCGHVGCCDSSPQRHARLHAHAVGHPIVQSFEPGEDWRWCFMDETFV
jgi:hypothetical protein